MGQDAPGDWTELEGNCEDLYAIAAEDRTKDSRAERAVAALR
jgi:hypothetical protein